jgi:predicted RNase H-like HicB family nuclease
VREALLLSYRIFWSKEDGEYVAECDEIPELSGLASSEAQAIKELKIAIGAWLDYLIGNGESLPTPGKRTRTRRRAASRHERAAAAT